MSYVFHTADVFTDTPFGGNQLAVLPNAVGLTDEQMQTIAREFNYSETVFVLPPENPAHTKKLRIFTPGRELPFAGHPTVGCAHVLARTGEIALTGDETKIVFEENAGPVPVTIRASNGSPVFAQLAAPRLPEFRNERLDRAAVAAVLSLDEADLDVDGAYAIEAVSVGFPFLMVPIRSLEALGNAQLNYQAWSANLSNTWAPEIFFFTQTAGENAERDAEFRARMFAPTMGIPEDPATGSACAAFGGYLASRAADVDRTYRYVVNQGVEMGRPSLLEVEADVSGGRVTAVRVGGSTVLVSSGVLHVL